VEQALIVRRWRRYGADRLYVTADTGAPLGSVDLATGQVALEAVRGAASPTAPDPGAPRAVDAVLAEAVRRAAQAYLRADLPEVVVPVADLVGPALPTPDPADAPRPRGRRARTAPDGGPDGSGTGTVDLAVPRDPAARGRHRADGLVSPRADGEHLAWREELRESLCDRLDRLALDGWHVLHDVPVGRQGSVVAHLLVGAPGAFAVAGTSRAAVAEHDDGPDRPRQYVLDGRYLSADGAGVPDLRDVRLTAARAGSLLRAAVGSAVTVRGVLVVHGTVELRDPAPFDAIVVPDGSVPEIFDTLPPRWTPGRVDAVAAVARRRATWALSRAV
jgi:hypothetical protein